MPKIRSFSSRIVTERVAFPRVVDEYSYNRLSKKPEKVGSKDIVAFVNAPARDTLLSTKMQRYFAGDLTALGGGNAQGIYTDISGMPTDYNTLSNMVKSVNKFVSINGFSTLPELLKDLANKRQDNNVPPTEIFKPTEDKKEVV